jgi:hypothetical protein
MHAALKPADAQKCVRRHLFGKLFPNGRFNVKSFGDIPGKNWEWENWVYWIIRNYRPITDRLDCPLKTKPDKAKSADGKSRAYDLRIVQAKKRKIDHDRDV